MVKKRTIKNYTETKPPIIKHRTFIIGEHEKQRRVGLRMNKTFSQRQSVNLHKNAKQKQEQFVIQENINPTKSLR